MDIQVSSNFERVLFELLDRDPAATSETMRAFRNTGRMPVPEIGLAAGTRRIPRLPAGRRGHGGGNRALRETAGYVADPHTVIGIAAARALPPPQAVATVALATAHPAKFPDAIEHATGVRPKLPPRLADLYERSERFLVLPNELGAVQAGVRALTRRNLA